MSATPERRTPLRGAWPILLAVVAGAGADVVLAVLGFAPDLLRVLLVAAVLGAVGAVLLGAQSSSPSWERRRDRPAVATGHDVRTSGHVRVIEDNRTARDAGPALRDRLRALTEQTLGVRHGLLLDDPAARARVGPRLRTVLDGPPRRLGVAELDACLDDIEGL